MTPKQTEKLRKKIVDIRRTLAAEKRRYGCYDDSRGIRYEPLRYFVQLGDYAGGLTYLKWFDKNFPDDGGFPEFLFESTIIFFKTGRTKEAANWAFRTFCSNPYWIEKFYGWPLTPLDIWHSSNVTTLEYTAALDYASTQPDLKDFAEWLRELKTSEEFTRRSSRYIDIYRRLKTETDKETRSFLVQEACQLEQSG